MSAYQSEREQIVEAGRLLVETGVLSGLEGNFSIRISQDQMLISPAGIKAYELKPQQMVIADFAGNLIQGSLKPSSGVPMHAMVYRLRPDVQAVIHTHSQAATCFAVAGLPIPDCLEVLHEFVGGEVPVAGPYQPLGTQALASNVKNAMTDSFAILLQNHGVLAFGRDMKHAIKSAWAVECTAKAALGAKSLGQLTEIPINFKHS